MTQATTERGWKHMMHIKRSLFGSTASLLAVPALAAAQFKKPEGTGLPEGDGGGVIGLITNIMNWLLVLVGILAVIAFVIAGILYLTSAGDEDQIGRAKRAMIWAIVGVVVALMGLIVLRAAESMLKGGATF